MQRAGLVDGAAAGAVIRPGTRAWRAVVIIAIFAAVPRLALSAAQITVSSPNGSETWDMGSLQQIQWVKGAGPWPAAIDIELSRNGGGTWEPIATVVANSSPYDSTVTGPPSADCLVRITDAADALNTDDSDATFTVVGAEVTSPNGGENWRRNSTHKITWISAGLTNVRIQYSTNGAGGPWTDIVASTDATAGYYEWTLPDLAFANNCYVQISDTDGTPSDQSDSQFSIRFDGSRVRVDSPDGGERGLVGLPGTIQWTSNNVTNVRIELSRDGGSIWEDIIASTGAAAGSYPWASVTGPGSTNCVVRISDADSPVNSPLDYSDAAFTIAEIIVTQPNGTEVWDVGTSQDITWTSTDVANVLIELSRDGNWTNGDGSDVEVIIASTASGAGGGSYTWDPVTGPGSANCLVRITDADNGAPSDTSGAVFEISDLPQSVAVTSPNLGTEVWDVGSSQDITWTSSNITDVRIELSRDGNWVNGDGSDVEVIDASAPSGPAGGSYTWNPVTGPPSENCLVRISDTDGSPSDVSDAAFTIRGVVVTAPNGTEVWDVGSSQDVTWTSAGIANVLIELSRDGNWTNGDGSDVEVIVDPTPAPGGSYTWNTVTGPGSTNCLVRVSDVADNTRNDVSDAAFTIAEAVVTAPNGTEVWDVGTSQDITWNSTDVTDVRIELSRDGNWVNGDGSDVEEIVASTPAAAGSYTWNPVTGPASTNCLVRVSDTDGSPSDDSDAAFEIREPPQDVTLTAPNGSEVWDEATSHDITWTSSGFANVHIELSRNGGSTWEDIVASTGAAGGSYTWNPVTGPPSSDCVVRVSDAADGSPVDVSDAAFTIAGAPTITVTSPDGGETWYYQGADQTITWTSYNIAATVDIRYSVDGGFIWTDIALGEPDDGSYTWTIPDEDSVQCLVEIEESGGSVSDRSDAVFTIKPATVAVTDPNGAETLDAGAPFDVTWTSEGLANVMIQVSRDGGTSWEDVVASTDAAAGPYTWDPVTGPGSSNCLIRISDAADGDPWDESDAPFSIAEIVVTSPAGGEAWVPDSSHDITWTAVGVANVKIWLSRDGGSTWTNIASGEPDDGSYTWLVTDPEADGCLIRVSDDLDPTPDETPAGTSPGFRIGLPDEAGAKPFLGEGCLPCAETSPVSGAWLLCLAALAAWCGRRRGPARLSAPYR